MLILRILHTFSFYLLLVLSYAIGTTLTLLFVPFVQPKTKLFQVAAQLWAKFLATFSGVSVTISGQANLSSNPPFILVSNHQSAADVLILLAHLPVRFRFAIKKELFKIPIFGWYLRQAGYFSIDRELVLSAYKTLDAITEIIKAGESVLLFPEGTRTRTGELGRFKRGSLLAALKSGAPLLPIAISGSFNIMPRGTFLIYPQAVKLSIGKPIYIRTEEEYNKKVEEVREAILKML